MIKRDETEKLMTEMISFIQAMKCEQLSHGGHGDAVYISAARGLEAQYYKWKKNWVHDQKMQSALKQGGK